MPATVREHVHARLVPAVVRARFQWGGRSPGVTVRAELADGRRAFAGAVSVGLDPDNPRFHRSETRIAGRNGPAGAEPPDEPLPGPAAAPDAVIPDPAGITPAPVPSARRAQPGRAARLPARPGRGRADPARATPGRP